MKVTQRHIAPTATPTSQGNRVSADQKPDEEFHQASAPRRNAHRPGLKFSLMQAFTLGNLAAGAALGVVIRPVAASCHPGYALQAEEWHHQRTLVVERSRGPILFGGSPLLYDDACDERDWNDPKFSRGVQGDCQLEAQATANANLPPGSYGDCDHPQAVRCDEGPSNFWVTYFFRRIFCIPQA